MLQGRQEGQKVKRRKNAACTAFACFDSLINYNYIQISMYRELLCSKLLYTKRAAPSRSLSLSLAILSLARVQRGRGFLDFQQTFLRSSTQLRYSWFLFFRFFLHFFCGEGFVFLRLILHIFSLLFLFLIHIHN